MQHTNAYDINYFAKSEAEKTPKLYVAKHLKKEKPLKGYNKSLRQTILIATWLISLISAVLYMQSIDTALSGEIAKKQQELTALESEYGYLNNEIEMRTNLINVETYATTQLGLIKREPSQTVYIYRGNNNQITYKQSLWQEVVGFFSGGAKNISEYIEPVT